MKSTNNSKQSPRRFIAVPYGVPADKRLGKPELRTLVALMGYRFLGKRGGDRDVVYPSRAKLSKWLGYSPNQISAITTRLEQRGWIVKTGNGGNSRATRYRLNWTVPGSEAEALVEEMQGQGADPGPEDGQGVSVSGPVDPDAHAGSDSNSSGSQNDHPGVDESDSGGYGKRTPGSAQSAEGHKKNEVEGNKEIKEEEPSARDTLAHIIVDFFLSSFRGLGSGIGINATADQYRRWCQDILGIVDDGSTIDEIKEAIKWVREANPQSKFPFRIISPTDLREKWPKVVAAQKWQLLVERSVEEERIYRQRRYAEVLLTEVPTMDGDDIRGVALSRLVDPRNKVPAAIAYCFCDELGLAGGLPLNIEFLGAIEQAPALQAAYIRTFPKLTAERIRALSHAASMNGEGVPAGEDQDDQPTTGEESNE